MSNKKIGIIGAMKIEIEALADKLEDRLDTTVSGITFHEGRLCGREVVLAVCGVGKVFAAICAQTMILRFGATAIINSGVAGGLDSRLKICSAVIADKVVQHDMDTSALGDPVGLISGINKVYFEADREMIAALEKATDGYPDGVFFGIIASGDQFIAEDSKKEWLRSTFGAIACEMEGAAIAHAAHINNVPFAVFRTISDGGDGMDFVTFSKIAAERAQEIILKFIEAYNGGVL